MPTNRGLLVAGALLFASPGFSQTAPERVEAAKKLIAEKKFPEALKALDALQATATDEATTLAVLELEGVALASTNKVPKATQAFQKLMLLDPEHKPQGKWAPKVMGLFNQAKAWVARVGGPCKLEELTPEIKGGVVVGVYFGLSNDPLKQTRKVRVHVRTDEAAWTASEIAANPSMKADVNGKGIEWWAELLGDKGAVLGHLGTEAEPIVNRTPDWKPKDKGAAPPDKKTDKPVANAKLTPKEKTGELPPSVLEPVPTTKSKVRILPLALIGGGAVAGGVGAYFGIQANSLRNQVNNAPVTDGVVTNISRAKALQNDSNAKTDAVLANSLIGAGVALAVGGAAWWFFGGREEAKP